MHQPALSQDIASAAQEALAFVAWLATGDELIDAALLLGGRKWQAVAQRVVMQARNGVAIEHVLPDLRRLRSAL